MGTVAIGRPRYRAGRDPALRREAGLRPRREHCFAREPTLAIVV